MGHEHDRLLVLRPQVQQKIAHDNARLRIKRAEGFIHQEIFRIADQHLRKTDALALSTRQHVRITVTETCKPDAAKPFTSLFARPGLWRASDFQSDGDIVQHGLPGHEGILLEEITCLAIESLQPLAADFDRTAGWYEKPGNGIEQCGLSAARRTDNRHEFVFSNVQIAFGDSIEAAAIGQLERNLHVLERDCCLACFFRLNTAWFGAHRSSHPVN